MGVEAGRIFADELPPPVDEDLLIFGVAHMDCLEAAFGLLRSQRVPLSTDLPTMMLEVTEEGSGPAVDQPTPKGKCLFCQGFNARLTKEDIYPTWLLKELRRYGARSKYEGRWSTKIVGYTTPVCEDCNHRWMSTVENDVKNLMISMFFHTRLLNRRELDRLALWAAIKANLFDVASDKPVVPRGFGHDLNIHRKPHRGMYVWIAAYTDKNPLVVIPRLIFASEHDEGIGEDRLIGWCVTFTIVRIVFQVFIPFVDGTLAPLETFNDSVVQLWPRQSTTLDWPPHYQFDSDSVQALAARIYDNREPVVTEVTLREAVRRPPEQEGF